jgi:UDP-N-acetylmuramate dehydrogenase
VDPLSDLRRITKLDEPMAEHTSFRLGGTVRYFIQPESSDEFLRVYQRCHQNGLRTRVLGGGSNVLVEDGCHDWAVLSTRRLTGCVREGTCVRAEAGLSLRRLLAAAERWGLGGLEMLAGIPGTVGGAVAMNAGGPQGTLGDRLVSARVVYPGGLPRELSARELGLGYRSSFLVDGLPCLLSARFQLEAGSPGVLRGRRRAFLAQKRAAQPLHLPSAGCIFKNPNGTSAGLLIDRAGLKGTVVGDAVVSDKHANFILNEGHATASDVVQLIRLIVERVHEVHGVWLDLEVKLWRAESPGSAPLRCEGKER